ncbi:hypothetical protein ACJJIX_12565 [Microbulbifer sp. VAAC004]|uniref:hypothetical protein n=1 Tax=unclassified Microbulbifer TaxID=2619833 RepID=UPI0040391661
MSTNGSEIKACYFINELSCYEVVKDFSSPVITALVAGFTVWFAFKKIGKQHRNTLDAQREESKRAVKIELFKEIVALVCNVSAVVREISSFCTVKKYSNIEMIGELNHSEYLELSGKLNHSLLAVVSKIESNEIVNPTLFRVSRYSLQSIVHDVMKLQFLEDRALILEKIIELTGDAQCYLGDFKVCMQNMTYGDVFNTKLAPRAPLDKECKVINNDPIQLELLEKYFLNETNWGKNNKRVNKEVAESLDS